MELSNPSRSYLIFNPWRVSPNFYISTQSLQFINEKSLAMKFFECEDPYEGLGIARYSLVVLNVETGEYEKKIWRPYRDQGPFSGEVCFLGDTEKYWEVFYEGMNGTMKLVINGKIIKTIEGEQISWILG